jgi:hypothetical protein
VKFFNIKNKSNEAKQDYIDKNQAREKDWFFKNRP